MNFVLSYFEQMEENEKTAVIYKDLKISYKDLIKKAKVVGTNLAGDVLNNDPVIIFMNKGIDALEAFFGVLYAGGCYSLINPEFPDTRINQIKGVLNNKVVITNDEFIERAKEVFGDTKIFNINDLINGEVNEEVLENIKNNKMDIDPVYINFTSGSTGVPKGVMVSNRSIVDFINKFTKVFNITSDDILANQAPFDFDVSVKDIYSAFSKGATLLIVPKEYFSNPSLLLDYVCDNKATVMVWAVSALCLITTFHGLDYKVPETVKKIIFSGEVMPIKHLKKWMEKLPNTMFVNAYGPTEITCNCTYHIIDNNRSYDEYIPIGKSFKNEKVFLLDQEDKLVTNPGEVGEICVSGSCLALGYYNNWDQTNAHFMQNPLNTKYFERIYRTGDLGRYDENGDLIFSGRKDFQIKYMGHRIELEEIDRAIMKVDNVVRTCTIFDEDKNRLYGFYIGDIETKDLKITLQKELPVYMVPTVLVKYDEFPITKNGKIDRKELLRRYKENI